jgi:hypothetical protein
MALETCWEHSGNRLGSDKKNKKIYWFKAGSSQYQYSNQYCIAKLHLISSYIISLVLSGCDGGGRPFHPSVPSSVPSSIHPSSSSRKKKMTEEQEEEEEEKLL